MADVFMITGAVNYKLTIDPSVWIFDDRKIDLSHYSGEEEQSSDDTKRYLQGTGAQWDKELKEGSLPPSERRSMIQERKALEGDYAMRLQWFLDNAQPSANASFLRIHRESGEPITLKLEEAKTAILQFSKDGKQLRERGPIYFYLPQMWKAKDEPIDGITALELIES
ncbi:MAG: hypothetical protein ACM32O_09225 [Clostridia bacterium]